MKRVCFVINVGKNWGKVCDCVVLEHIVMKYGVMRKECNGVFPSV